MRTGFTSGLIIGSMVGASVSMMMNPDMMRTKGRRKMMKAGRRMLHRSTDAISGVIDMFR